MPVLSKIDYRLLHGESTDEVYVETWLTPDFRIVKITSDTGDGMFRHQKMALQVNSSERAIEAACGALISNDMSNGRGVLEDT
jgi:hypothetical protein